MEGSWFLSFIPISVNTDALGLEVGPATISKHQHLKRWEFLQIGPLKDKTEIPNTTQQSGPLHKKRSTIYSLIPRKEIVPKWHQ